MSKAEQLKGELVEGAFCILETEAHHISCASYEGDNDYLRSVAKQILYGNNLGIIDNSLPHTGKMLRYIVPLGKPEEVGK